MGTLGYVTVADFIGTNRYYEFFAEELYGTNGTLTTGGSTTLISDIDFSYRTINDEMRSTGKWSLLPIQKDRNGDFPQAMQAWNAYDVIFRKLISRFQGEFEQIPDSINIFGTLAMRYARIVKEGGAIFAEDIDAGELGIGMPELVGALGSNTRGTFFNNWRGFPYPDSFSNSRQLNNSLRRGGRSSKQGFTGSDFPRTWIVQIDTAGGIGTATYKWSMNGGKDYEDTTVLTDEDWEELEDNVWIRWSPDDQGSNAFTVGDKWKFQTVPEHIRRQYGSEEGIVGNIGRSF